MWPAGLMSRVERDPENVATGNNRFNDAIENLTKKKRENENNGYVTKTNENSGQSCLTAVVRYPGRDASR